MLGHRPALQIDRCFRANEVPWVHSPHVDKPAALLANSQNVGRATPEQGKQRGDAEPPVDELGDLGRVEHRRVQVHERFFRFAVPERPDRGLPRLVLAQCVCTEADLEPGEARVFRCFQFEVHQREEALRPDDLPRTAANEMDALTAEEVQHFVLELDLQQLLAVWAADLVLEGRAQVVAALPDAEGSDAGAGEKVHPGVGEDVSDGGGDAVLHERVGRVKVVGLERPNEVNSCVQLVQMHGDSFVGAPWPERLPVALDGVDDFLHLSEGAWRQDRRLGAERDPDGRPVGDALAQQVPDHQLRGVALDHVGQHALACCDDVLADPEDADLEAVDERPCNRAEPVALPVGTGGLLGELGQAVEAGRHGRAAEQLQQLGLVGGAAYVVCGGACGRL